MPWMTKSGFSPAATPFISITPYCVEALLAFSDVTNDDAAQDVALSSLEFMENHLHKLVDSPRELAISYGPEYGTRIVINGSSYAMMLYALLASRLPEKQDFLSQKAMRLFNFISSRMNPDGSWFYYADNENGNFIDCFHSCFILKNIFKYGKLINADVFNIVDRGLGYLLSNFLDDKKYLVRRFTFSCNPSLTKYDLYDQSELLNVLLLTGRLDIADCLYNSIMDNFFIVKKGTFGQQIDIFGLLHKMPYLRWAIMPMIYTLSEYYKLTNLCHLDTSNAASVIYS